MLEVGSIFFDDNDPQTRLPAPLGAVCIPEEDNRDLEVGEAALAALVGGIRFLQCFDDYLGVDGFVVLTIREEKKVCVQIQPFLLL
ncbi:uncharacterized protein EV420DRAFT_1645406 [Desarmillaria tabescens]|uniref:Uncharacterized protein n=1 Tax=Armillaria tabescens TaxID=1929756 RepID=A0AA39N0E6_ARMTA|nr:uncharacterized protein EV420DRAFT_1645406 [Desarmillaria tabescens]KAK0452883.1 hypothetical protein EV420DRAFT_1645406 [Desarmillaria tabescens]